MPMRDQNTPLLPPLPKSINPPPSPLALKNQRLLNNPGCYPPKHKDVAISLCSFFVLRGMGMGKMFFANYNI
jgi:hypothetical protein